MPVLHDTGLRSAEDIAVIGFDDILEAEWAYPPLSTIAVNPDVIARQAVSMLIHRIDGTRSGAPALVRPPFQLVARRSTFGMQATTPRTDRY